MLLTLYDALMRALRPLLLRKLRRRGQLEPLYLHAVHQRFGQYTAAERTAAADGAGQWVWVHAVSLGEMRTAAILLQALRAQCTGLRLLLTQGTATGWQEGQKLLHPGDMQVWLPWDSKAATTAFVQTFRPRLGVLMETEMWPQLLLACRQKKVPVVLANARLSEKTLRQSQRMRALARAAYGSLCVAYAQTAQDAQRLQQLGAQTVRVTGNLKFDASPEPAMLAKGQVYRQRLQAGTSRPVALLASSREGEEQQWLQAWQALPVVQRCAMQWMVVPRHPQRFDEVAALLQQAGWQVLRRSQWDAAPALPCDAGGQGGTLWLGDSLGEMPLYYAMADVALMGGSYAPLGGQNLIEACACGCPVLLGPHTFNFADASAQAIAAGAALRCANMQAAVQQALELCVAEAGPADGGNADAKTPVLATMQVATARFSNAHRGAAHALVQDLLARSLL